MVHSAPYNFLSKPFPRSHTLLEWPKRQDDNSDVISSCMYVIIIFTSSWWDLGMGTDVFSRLYYPRLLKWLRLGQVQVQYADEFGYMAYLYIVISICRYKYGVLRTSLAIPYNIQIETLGRGQSELLVDWFSGLSYNSCMQMLQTADRHLHASLHPSNLCRCKRSSRPWRYLKHTYFRVPKARWPFPTWTTTPVPRLDKNIIVVLETGKREKKKTPMPIISFMAEYIYSTKSRRGWSPPANSIPFFVMIDT